MIKVEFTGSVEEVKKEIREFIEVNCTEVINSTEKAISKALDNARAVEKSTPKVEDKKEEVKKVEEAPAPKLPTAPAKKEEAPVEVATPLPTKTAEYTAADLQKIAAAWVNKDIDNNRVALVNLLASFEVKAITFLPKEKYGAFVQELKNLGADV
ncbi:hypothetical protein KSU03_06035 [Fusobacterium polymorphum]|uniref:Uncharacterized protein n=1 Tax=Fusobacterium nucleatum subsp. polymorphum TaxID=76857 RepID=A0A2C6AN49_FUSNP|nr:hypothetical protein [Fusobacterium polymorphum]PHI03549.1 hypothetical protein CBG52_12880 [Fusobacterium polymorphum]